ncbi:LutB/LldF family L-lactate oxidation iron-sulfur protein [Burkholderia thailandensis]|uniref:LutB/LldF family L-lactate oxidation iron-sulfur protein n=1 Tax=Burkholderia thailandensis TaxID=57975 RepID=UPI0003EC9967|nr:LutB/LldF family L-lactate oxidation iron-sulfur protein [Burkholderia thailandensis]AHI66541.1 iron-sulfur cluster-binding protein [Burkholderia thailandensis H0587]AOJ54547.1 (Fe-S)-binding protein [Burkholderia thailandensis]AVR27284.1 iron-sulfur cluster-binding protein [Burkholderia thailandensis]MCZ2896113.1 LutB/LldF family L-lactate oxidation iron-sulfur protein [Burkholderia thailandensis]
MSAQPSTATPTFKARASAALHDAQLQEALGMLGEGWIEKRRRVVSLLPEFEMLRERAKAVKDHVLANLDTYLERYEAAVTRAGGVVHWASDAAQAREIVLKICRDANAKTITRGKSMVGEEIGLPGALEGAGMEVVETDLGEYIVQLAHEGPSHIVFPALHKTIGQVTELFAGHHSPAQYDGPRETVADVVGEARQVLREKFFVADVGITGANYLVAETGSNVICTNEGNGDLTSTLARVHIVTAGIERVVPTLDDVALFVRLLGRSATGQEITSYTTFSTGPKRGDDLDGPQEYHVVLVDNGRTRMLAGEFRDMLRCIRCGACMNHCPVYGAVGGHAYGWVYPGPMGAVLTPLLQGIEHDTDLPNACTLNGRCAEVCPVKIPLPTLLKKLRGMQFDARLTAPGTRFLLRAFGVVARRPALYHWLTRVGARVLRGLGGKRGSIARVPFASGWTDSRELPKPPPRTFFETWDATRANRQEVRR